MCLQDAGLAGLPLQLQPLLQLRRVNGYSGHVPRLLQWAPGQQELVLAAGALVTVMSGGQTDSMAAVLLEIAHALHCKSAPAMPDKCHVRVRDA